VSLSEQLDAAIAAHGMWKAKLKMAITSGKIEAPIATIRADDACAFGKWLGTLPPSLRESAHFGVVKGLHADFHRAAADVASLATTHKATEAAALMSTTGAYTKTSMSLIRAITDWKKAAQ
jgi:hypothetical protein